MKKQIHVSLNQNSYNITIQRNLINNIGAEVKKIHICKKIFIITDHNVSKIYMSQVTKNLQTCGFAIESISLNAGEQSKSLTILPSIYNALAKFKLNRTDLIIVLGGGVIGDIGGFVASTFLRGINFIQIPTSLLAQVDSSVGGKVGVNLPYGKNLVGSFYQPIAVFIDPNVLNTLPNKFYIDGMAEIIKYGCIKDKNFFYFIKSKKNRYEIMEHIEDIIYTCCSIKKEIIQNDLRDFGERMVLNFGHTLGHAIEKQYNYTTYTHGQAVSIGMYNETLISEQMGITKKGTAKEIKDILTDIGLPYQLNIQNKEEILEIISLDKKNINNALNIVLLKNIGTSFIFKTTSTFFENI